MKGYFSKVLVASCLVAVTWLPGFAKATVYKSIRSTVSRSLA